MLEYLWAGVIPQGLRIKNIPGLFVQLKAFLDKWSMIANRCSRDLMMLIVETAKEMLQELISETLELENKIKNNTAVDEAKKKLEELGLEMNAYTEYLNKKNG